MRKTFFLDEIELRAAMVRAGIRGISEVGRRAGLSASYARLWTAGFVPSEPVREAVAKVLGVAPSKLWRSKAGRTA